MSSNKLSVSSEDYKGSSIEINTGEAFDNFLVKSQIDEFIGDAVKLAHECSSIGDDLLEKAKKDLSKLVRKEVWATNKMGKTYKTTVWVLADTGEEAKDVQVKQELAEIDGLKIQKYSDKSVLIHGDTYASLETLRDIKKEIGSGTFNRKLGGWIFPIAHISTVLGKLISKNNEAETKTEEQDSDKAVVAQNAEEMRVSYAIGSNVQTPIGKGTITDSEHNGENVRYTLKLDNGKVLKDMTKADFTVLPGTDKQAAEAINSGTPENRNQARNVITGALSTKDQEVLLLTGLGKKSEIIDLQEKRDAMIKRLRNLSQSEKKPSTPSSGEKKSSGSSGRESISKKELNALLAAKGMMSVDEYYQDVFGEAPVTPEESQRRSDAMRGNQNAKKDGTTEEEPKKEVKKEEVEPEKKPKGKDPEPPKKPKGKDEETTAEFIERMRAEIAEKNKKIKKRAEKAKPEGGEVKVNERTGKLNADVEFTTKEIELTTTSGEKIKVNDMSDASPRDMTLFNVKNVLDYDRPNYIPEVGDDQLRQKKMAYEAVIMPDGKYLVNLTHGGSWMGQIKVDEKVNYVMLNKEQFVSMYNYYLDRAKAKNKIEGEARTQRSKDHWDSLPQSTRDRYPGGYKKYGSTRVKVMKKGYYLSSQNAMYKKFIDDSAGRREVQENIIAQFDDMELAWNNLTVARQDYSGAFQKGKETSYGKEGTENTLKKTHGINIKRQDGSDMGADEADHIKNAMDQIYGVFGDRTSMATKYDLTVSHAGKRLQHASKAVGMFLPGYHAIGTTMKMGAGQFGFTLAHEYAHFMDYYMAEKGETRGTFASHDKNHIAGKISNMFRDNLNDQDLKSDKYKGNSHECFARALEQHFAVESGTVDEGFEDQPDHVKKDTFAKEVRPLIMQLFKEKNNILKSILDELNIIG